MKQNRESNKKHLQKEFLSITWLNMNLQRVLKKSLNTGEPEETHNKYFTNYGSKQGKRREPWSREENPAQNDSRRGV